MGSGGPQAAVLTASVLARRLIAVSHASRPTTTRLCERSLLELRRAITETRRPEVPLLLDEYLQLVVQFGCVLVLWRLTRSCCCGTRRKFGVPVRQA